MIYIPPIFFLVVAIVLIFNIIINGRSKARNDKFAELVTREANANESRKKPIPEDMFYMPDFSAAPFNVPAEKLSERAKRVVASLKKFEGKKMLRVKGMTNTEIKEQFGLVNLEFVTEYEDNYNVFLRLLNDCAEAFIKDGMVTEAEGILNICVENGSDMSRTYIMLADIYNGRGDNEGLGDLRRKVSAADLHEPVKNKIIKYMEDFI